MQGVDFQIEKLHWRLRNQWLTQQIREAGQQMDDPDTDPTQLIQIMKRRQDLERMKRQVIKLPEME